MTSARRPEHQGPPDLVRFNALIFFGCSSTMTTKQPSTVQSRILLDSNATIQFPHYQDPNRDD